MDTVVKVSQGKLQGKVLKNYVGEEFFGFLGIPYAKTPIDDLRFKAPEEPEPWQGVLDATKEGPGCPSLHLMTGFLGMIDGNENNCLNLNVFTKKLPITGNDKLKPVMVFIHGGGFVFGNNKSILYGPDFLMAEDIVLVIINYRLTIFGFLSCDDPALGVPGNNGLKDQVMALKWVQKNIKSFCGDSNNVTIFGQSAGSVSVHHLMLSPMAKGLFHKAILKSGTTSCIWAKGTRNNIIIAGKLMKYKETDERTILKKLKQEPWKKIADAWLKYRDDCLPGTVRPFGVVIETNSNEPAFLTQDPEVIIKTGNYNHVPMIIGNTTNEGLVFDFSRIMTGFQGIENDFNSTVPYDLWLKDKAVIEEVAQKVKDYYFKDKPLGYESIAELRKVIGDSCFLYPIHKMLKLHQSVHKYPIFFYMFSFEGPLNICKEFSISKYIMLTRGLLGLALITSFSPAINNVFQYLVKSVPKYRVKGTSHCDELGYLFKQDVQPHIEKDSMNAFYIKRMVKLWTNFAKYGHPTPESDEELFNKTIWRPISKNAVSFLDIGENLQYKNYVPDQAHQFWEDIYRMYGNREENIY